MYLLGIQNYKTKKLKKTPKINRKNTQTMKNIKKNDDPRTQQQQKQINIK